MTATLTKNEFLKFLNTTIGKQYDFDGYYGYQCFDYANIGWNKLFGHGLKGASAKDIPFNAENKANFKKEATVFENTPSFKAQPCDLVVFDEKYGEGDGHVAWVISATLNEITVLEQNWQGGGWTDGIERGGKGWEIVTKRTHAYDFPMWFIRPKFKAETAKTESIKKENTTQKTKQRTIKYDRTTVKNASVIPKRGYKPKGVIIHNTADDLTPKQQKNRMMNYNAGQLADGIAHSYVGDGEIWQALPESYSAWHAGEAWANQNLYGIEAGISSNTSKDKAIRIEQTALQEAARMLKKWNLPVNEDTVFLHNEFTATRCPVRSMELHANWYSTQRAPQQIVDKMKEYFIDQIKQYYKGEMPKGSTVKPSKPSSNTSTGKWSKNQHGTWWMKESATFTCGGSPILARVGSPFLTAQEGYWFQPGGYVNYDEVCIQDGHVWIGYTFKGVRYYLPIRTVKGTPPNHLLGDLWGAIK
ncbi:SH3 domain-containing protein [Mammaliicoccus sciuri]|uniref:SH3 domain-containing protein n=1 Tax=Mammaliicoccus sciuri TaxID=1296 RepID=UPI002DB821F0|nr:SH3 domain-containing protein [Mammaliicoccus sciuri]MEB7816745.1 SH3 domain-containing protein [Mammaliicoccus sciuri]